MTYIIKTDKKKTPIVILLFCFLFLSTSAYATCTGSSPTWISSADYSSVSTCINSASAGDTINVQSGSSTWNSTLTITKHISLIGGYGGTTIITNGPITMRPTINSDGIIQRLSGFTFVNGSTHINLGDYGYNATRGQEIMYVRIDHCNFSYSYPYGIWNGGGVYGVVDHCTFGSPSSTGFAYALWGQSNWDDTCYSTTPQMYWQPGSEKSMYFEDNVFYIQDSGRLVAHNYASRGVYRYNTIHILGNNYSQGLFELHGHNDWMNGSTHEEMPSTFGIEEYGNIVLNAGALASIYESRGGKSMVFYNTTLGSTPGAHAYSGDVGYWSCATIGPNQQMINNTYLWNNRGDYTGSTGSFWINLVWTGTCGGLTNHPVAGRDIIVESQTTPGVTYGTMANRPSSCSTGQGYWATNQSTTNLTSYVGDINNYPSRQTISGTLYKCTATNTWTAFYTPYTYPHPLTYSNNSIRSGITLPSPPLNLMFKIIE